MKKLLSVVTGLILMISTSVFAEEKLTIEKQLVGIVGAISGTVKTETRELLSLIHISEPTRPY